MTDEVFTNADFPFPEETGWGEQIELDLFNCNAELLAHPTFYRLGIRAGVRTLGAKLIMTQEARWWLQWQEGGPSTSTPQAMLNALTATLEAIKEGRRPKPSDQETYFGEVSWREAFELAFISKMPAIFVRSDQGIPIPWIPIE